MREVGEAGKSEARFDLLWEGAVVSLAQWTIGNRNF